MSDDAAALHYSAADRGLAKLAHRTPSVLVNQHERSLSVGILEAKGKLSRLVALAERGRETVITRNDKPVARLVPATLLSRGSSNTTVIERIRRFSRTIKLRRRADLRALIDEGRL